MTLAAIPANLDTITIQGIVYTFKTTIAAAYDVQIDQTWANDETPANLTISENMTAENLANAITASGNAGIFGAGTVANPYVSPSVVGAVVTLTSTVWGSLGNACTLATSDSVKITLSGSTLAGGVDATYAYPDDLTALKSVLYGSFPPLVATTPALLDLHEDNWRNAAPGTPRNYYRLGSGKIGFYPPTDGSTPVMLVGVSVPCDQTEVANGIPLLVDTTPPGTSTATPAIPWRYHKALAYGAVLSIISSPLFDIEGGAALQQYCLARRADLVARYAASMAHQGEDAL